MDSNCSLNRGTLLGYILIILETSMTSSVPATISLPSNQGSDRKKSTSYAADKAKITARLRRVEGQVRGVQKMVEEDQYCLDVLTQLSAIIAGVRATGLMVLDDHIRGCVLGTCRHGHENQEEILDELTEAIERFTKSVG
jgi:DNA-binding FrmR family transcriptional regulator